MSRRKLITHQRLYGPINLQSLALTLASLNDPLVQVIIRLLVSYSSSFCFYFFVDE